MTTDCMLGFLTSPFVTKSTTDVALVARWAATVKETRPRLPVVETKAADSSDATISISNLQILNSDALQFYLDEMA